MATLGCRRIWGGGGQTPKSYGHHFCFCRKSIILNIWLRITVTFTTALTLTSTCSHMMANWRDLIKDELSQLHGDAVGRRETIVPMIAQLPLPCESQAVIDELAAMQSTFTGTVPGLVNSGRLETMSSSPL